MIKLNIFNLYLLKIHFIKTFLLNIKLLIQCIFDIAYTLAWDIAFLFILHFYQTGES